jgi:hypothetical protein
LLIETLQSRLGRPYIGLDDQAENHRSSLPVTLRLSPAKNLWQRGTKEMRVQQPTEITSDPDAFDRFYRRHVEAVQRFVARRVDDPYLAADLTADVFVAAIESAGSYRRSRGEPVA